MNKEPIALYIFRYILGFGLFAFMAMLYWSSALIEEDLKFLRLDFLQLKTDMAGLRSDFDKKQAEFFKIALSQARPIAQDTASGAENLKEVASQTDSTHPNLLQEDIFTSKTLPEMLGKDFKPEGIRKDAIFGKPDNLNPFAGWAHTNEWIGMCTGSVANQEFGKYEALVPDLAVKLELRKGKDNQSEYWIHLRKDAFWSPLNPAHFSQGVILAPQFLVKHPVTAHDFKFYLDVIMNPHVQDPGAMALKTYLQDIQDIEVVDDYTFIVRWKTKVVKGEDGKEEPQMKYVSKLLTGSLKPLASFVYQYFADGKKIVADDKNPDTYRTNRIWAQNFSHHWAKNIIPSCGPWLFDGMTDRLIRFKRNPDYYIPHAVLVDEMEIEFKDSPDAIWEAFKAGTIDSFLISPNQLAELDRFLQSAPYKEQEKKGLAIHRLDYIARSYTYIGWNEARPYFNSKKVRQAITMAINRKRIIEQNLNDRGIEITGTFFRYSPSYDESIVPYPYDIQKAQALLEEEGWYDSDGDGVIDKEMNGTRVPFTFKLTYYVKNPTSKSICEYIATALKEVGINCHLNGVDIADISAVFDDKNFDALCLAWSLGSPPEDPKQLWYSTGAKEKGSSNAIGFANTEIDKIIDRLEYEYDPKERIALYHQFDRLLYDEAPYTFIYTPKSALIYRDYLQNVFLPIDRQDLIPGATVAEPQSSIFWIKNP